MRLTVKTLSYLFLLISALSYFSFSQPCFAEENFVIEQAEIKESETDYVQGRILEVLEEKDIEIQGITQKYQKLKVLVIEGALDNKEIIVENGASVMAQVILYQKGDTVIMAYTKDFEGKDSFFITDFVRTNGILILFIFFVFISVLIGSKKGFLSLLSMAASFVIIFTFVLPQIQAGRDPVLIAILASIVIIPITFYMSHGFEKKITVSVVATFIALIITGLLSSFFVNLTHLSGTASEEALFLQMSNGVQYNLKGLLLAGIIIGTLGVMDDITVSQTAIVYQLNDLKKDLAFSELFKRSIQIGKDHIASMINTLILVYTGASMPLLLLFMNNPRPFDEILNFELISTEIVRTLVGSIGLILAVPITTYLACYFAKKNSK